MPVPLLATKLYIPPPRAKMVPRPRLIAQMNEGLRRTPGVTLISAPAGFGKTTLISEWIADCRLKIDDFRFENQQSEITHLQFCWLSLDEGDNDPARLLAYLVAALRAIAANFGEGVLAALQSPQSPPTELLLTTLVNEIAALPEPFVLVLDDCHVIEAQPANQVLAFLVEHLPPQMHLVIATREDPPLPLARLRARDQLTELRVADLSFTLPEAAGFLTQAMGLNLSAEEVAALETRTEGWIAGLQLAAISMQGYEEPNRFIKSFTGSHHFVLDYLVEEVLKQQPERVQAFLLSTSILDRFCAPLCEAVLRDPSGSGQEIIENLERSNLFVVPLDNERRWYRYHHLFAELLRQRLQQSLRAPQEAAESRLSDMHVRASQWFEDNQLEMEAFQHAAAAQDVERAVRLLENKRMPLYFRGSVTAVLDWLGSLPESVLNSRPWLWWRYASLLLVNGQSTGVEEKLRAAEAALQRAEPDDETRNLIGRIAVARATLCLTHYQTDTMLAQSRRALEFLHPSNVSIRATAYWTLGVALFFKGDRAASRQAYNEALSLSLASGETFTTILASIGVGNVQQADNQLYLAAESYRRVLQLGGDQPLQVIGEAHLSLAHILYEWNELDAAEQHARQSLILVRQFDTMIDRFILCEVFLARLKLAQRDVEGAVDILARAEQSARQKNFMARIPDVAAAQVLALLRQGNLAEAARLAEAHKLPISQARVHLAQGNASAALALLEPLRRQVETKGWADERLKVLVLQSVALSIQGERGKAMHLLVEALSLAEPGGFVRLFTDEGEEMKLLIDECRLLNEKYPTHQGHSLMGYLDKLVAAFTPPEVKTDSTFNNQQSTLIEPLSQRELEILQLIAQGLSNVEISNRLFLALPTVKGHNQNIFEKLQVKRRTEAVARARELGIL